MGCGRPRSSYVIDAIIVINYKFGSIDALGGSSSNRLHLLTGADKQVAICSPVGPTS